MALDRHPEAILVVTTGGTIDKVYFDDKSSYEVGRTIIDQLLHEAQVRHPYHLLELMQKDSLDLTDADRTRIADAIAANNTRRVVITHGTDTMTDTAARLEAADALKDRVIVLTGSLSPARFARTDATFNVGLAFGAVQSLDQGVYIAMNGEVFRAAEVVKNRDRNLFERR